MNINQLQHKQYLGDSVYVGFDGYQFWLYTDNGFGPTNEIALEPEVIGAFLSYLKLPELFDRNIL